MSLRSVVLPALAAALVAGVLGAEVAAGGRDFTPHRAADPCVERSVAAVSGGLDGLAEELVLLGLDGAACRLGVSREALVLRLGGPGERTDSEVEAVRGGLRDAVDRLDREGRLPPVSALVAEALAQSKVPAFVAGLIRSLPDGFIDSRLATDDVLRKTLDGLDIRKLLDGFDDPARVQTEVVDAVTQAAIDVFLAGLPNPFAK